jgi:folate-binding protein YgfZ
MASDIRNSFSIHRYHPAAWLRVAGPDAAAFLQGQFTNELRGLAAGEAVYGLWLDQKGKIVADSFVLSAGADGDFRVGSLFSPAAAIRPRLEEYIIADDVTVDDLTADWAGIALLGDGAEAWWRAESGLPGHLFPGRRGRMPAWEWIYPLAEEAAVSARLAGAKETGGEEMERWRIEARIPAVPRDAGPTDLPNEAGLENIAISYTKGCYLGQEIMARLKSRGNVRRRLFAVAGSGAAPALPAKLWQEGRPAGELRSAATNPGGAGFRGLAMLTLGGLRRELPLTARSAAASPPAEASAKAGAKEDGPPDIRMLPEAG